MKLRTRLALTSASVIAPLVGALLFFDAIGRRRATERVLTEISSSVVTMEREQCEDAPQAWGGRLGRNRTFGAARGARLPPLPPPPGPRRPPPPQLYAYADDLRSAHPDAPALSPPLRSAIANGSVASDSSLWAGDEVTVLSRTAWGHGPCAFVLARGAVGDWGALLPATQFWILPMLAVLATVLLAVGPVVRRIRRLTDAVHTSASAAYEPSIPTAGGDEIGELGRAFDAAGRKIRVQLEERIRSEQALRDFVANTTHDVMIPLSVLQGHLVALRDRLNQIGMQSDRAAVGSAMDEAHYMASLIHDLAAAARLEVVDAELQRTRVDLTELIARVTSRHRTIALQRGVSFESATPDEPLHANADITLLEQAVSNIAYNAIRYNAAGGHVALVLDCPLPGRFRIRVDDDGPGIDQSDLSKLIERGQRGQQARSRAPEGQGLGLHIAYRAATLQGYQLNLMPLEPKGLRADLEGDLA